MADTATTTGTNVTLPASDYLNMLSSTGGTVGSAVGDISTLLGQIGAGVSSYYGTNEALKALQAGSTAATGQVQNALTAASSYAQPYISAGTTALPDYLKLLQQQAGTNVDYNALLGQTGAAYAPYTATGAAASNQLGAATNALQNVGSSQQYYNQMVNSPEYAQYIAAGGDALKAQQALAQATAAGYSYDQFKNSGYYQALQAANTQAQNQLAAQAGASGMTGSGTMANALGKSLQSNYANYFGTAQTANLQQQQAAAAQYQTLVNQGMSAQQAAATVANNMMTSDVSQKQAVVNALQNQASQGLSAQQAAASNAMTLGGLQQSQQSTNINSLYNAAMMGNATAQQLMNNYLTGANIIGQNTMAAAQAQAQAAITNATTTGKISQSAASALTSLAKNPVVGTALSAAMTKVGQGLGLISEKSDGSYTITDENGTTNFTVKPDGKGGYTVDGLGDNQEVYVAQDGGVWVVNNAGDLQEEVNIGNDGRLYSVATGELVTEGVDPDYVNAAIDLYSNPNATNADYANFNRDWGTDFSGPSDLASEVDTFESW